MNITRSASHKASWLIVSILILNTKVFAQSVSTLIGARAMGLANVGSTLNDEWALFNNVGGLAKVDKPATAFAYEIKPALPGASRLAAAFIAPFKFGTAGFGVFRFGDNIYSEQIISGAFSNQLGIASLGLKLNYIQYHAEGYGIQNAISINFGGVCDLTQRIAIGAYITNINQPKISSRDNEHLPTRLTAGISFKPVDKISLLTEIAKDLEYKATIKGAFEYLIYKKIFFRTGFNLQPNAGYFGLGFVTKRLKLDYGMQYSSAMRFAYQASIIYQFEKKAKKHEK